VPERRQDDALPKTSSFPEETPEAQVALFRDVLRTIEKNHIPYAVSGAFALRHHTGIYRFTKDLDLFLAAEMRETALDCLRQTADCTVYDPVWLSKVSRDGFFVDLITGMSNGLIVVDGSWIERARPAVVCGVNTTVLAAEELVASKLFVAKRERFDGADIAHVIYGTSGDFDWNREMELAGAHWEMLLWALVLFRYVYPAQTHYVPRRIWRELLDRFEDEIQEPDPHAEFRGSLVDDNMFAIDVNEWGLPDLLQRSRQQHLLRLAERCTPERNRRANFMRKAI
jgi:hypothetical protein